MNSNPSYVDFTPADLRTMKAHIEERRTLTTAFDIIFENETLGEDPERAADVQRPWAEAGATRWLEAVWQTPETLGGIEGMRTRVTQGPPRP